jgi:hypothetical protein
MTSEEAVVGSRVRVSGQYRVEHLRGQVGMITKRWGNPRYIALDVLMDDGSSPYGPVLIEALDEAIYIARRLKCGLWGPEQEDSLQPKVAFDQSFETAH